MFVFFTRVLPLLSAIYPPLLACYHLVAQLVGFGKVERRKQEAEYKDYKDTPRDIPETRGTSRQRQPDESEARTPDYPAWRRRFVW